MESFSKDAAIQYKIASNMLEEMDSLYTDLAKYFSFNKQHYPFNCLMKDIKTFKEHFKVKKNISWLCISIGKCEGNNLYIIELVNYILGVTYYFD